MAAAVAFFGATHDAINQLAPCFQPFQGDALSEGPGRKGDSVARNYFGSRQPQRTGKRLVPGRRPDSEPEFLRGLAQSALRPGWQIQNGRCKNRLSELCLKSLGTRVGSWLLAGTFFSLIR
jgi:hypothetical protein